MLHFSSNNASIRTVRPYLVSEAGSKGVKKKQILTTRQHVLTATRYPWSIKQLFKLSSSRFHFVSELVPSIVGEARHTPSHPSPHSAATLLCLGSSSDLMFSD